MVALEEHHIKYKELDGIDETIMMSVSDHRKLHIRNGFHVPRHIVVKAHHKGRGKTTEQGITQGTGHHYRLPPIFKRKGKEPHHIR